MSADNLETLYRLTPSGWIEGEERYFGTIQSTVKER